MGSDGALLVGATRRFDLLDDLAELEGGATVSGFEPLEGGQYFVTAGHDDQVTRLARRTGPNGRGSSSGMGVGPRWDPGLKRRKPSAVGGLLPGSFVGGGGRI
jgi:hypothetical protein